ncbi:MAG: alcohol dehydrogenase catalytic domain-containing protein [Bdellovibrionota bacterium]
MVHERAKGFTRVPLASPPSLKNDDVLIRPRWVGICGSDLYLIAVHDGPLRLGHEWIGVVEKVGPEVEGLKVGDLVTSTGTVACFECGFCENEKTNFCDSAVYFSSDKMGALRSWFVLGELIAVAEAAVDLIEENEPRSTSRGAETRRRELLVLGAGPVGLLLAQVAKDRGFEPVIVDKIGFRVDLARQAGLNAIPFAQALIDPSFQATSVYRPGGTRLI